MKKKLAAIAFAGASLAMFAGAPSAGAGHCVAPATEEPAPGFSYFGTDHVQSQAHDSEGEGKHSGTAGASNCRANEGSPSDRAPGQAAKAS